MKTYIKIRLLFVLLAIACFSNASTAAPINDSTQISLDSVINYLTGSIWYDTYSGDLPVVGTTFKLVPGSIDSIEWNSNKGKLLLIYNGDSSISAWTLSLTDSYSYMLNIVNNDSFVLKSLHRYPPSYIYFSHTPPRPSSLLEKNEFIDQLIGDWYVRGYKYNYFPSSVTMIHIERNSSSPYSISLLSYAHDSLVMSEHYGIIKTYYSWDLLPGGMHWKVYLDSNELILYTDWAYCSGCYRTNFSRNPEKIKNTNLTNNILIIYPNPCSNSFSINENFTNCKLEVIGIDGQVKLSKFLHEKDDRTIDISGLSRGMYLVRVSINNSLYTAKIVKE